MNRFNLVSDRVVLFLSVFLFCLGQAALAGNYASGVLLLHGSPLIASSEPTDYDNLSQIASCEDVVAQLPEGPGAPGQGRVAYVLAAFLRESYAVLQGVTFGIEWDPSSTAILYSGSCADFELTIDGPNGAWPSPGSGTAVTWHVPQSSTVTEVYYFACYGYAGSQLSLIPHPSQGATFAHSGQLGPRTAPIEALGTLGFGEPGEHPCVVQELENCCLPDRSCTQLPWYECHKLGGMVRGLGPCDPNPCPPPTGACCLPAGLCDARRTVEGCEAEGGTYLGDGTFCEYPPCARPLGACCGPDDSCSLTTSDECDYAFWVGEFTECAPNPCPIPPVACCFLNGDCVLMEIGACVFADGHFTGDTCDPNPCPEPPGACCYSEAGVNFCRRLSAQACAARGGEMYFRDDADCPPDACENPVGACCFANGDCGEMLREQCDIFSGDYQGDGSACEPVHCAVAPTEHASWGAIKVRYR